MKKTAFIRQTFCAVFFLCIITAAWGQDSKLNNRSISPRIYLYPEYFMPVISTTIRVDAPDFGLGTTLNLEDELGFNKSPATFRVHAIAGSGAQFTLSYMNINRQGSAYLERDVTFADTVYHAGANTSAYFNSQIFGAGWRFCIVNNSIWSGGISIGGKWMQVGTGINVQSGEIIYSRDEKAGIPIPLGGLHGSVYFTPRLLGRASLEYFHFNISGYDVTAQDFRFSAEYYLLKNLGAGAAYSTMKYDMNKLPFSDKFSGEINYSLKGFSVFIAARF